MGRPKTQIVQKKKRNYTSKHNPEMIELAVELMRDKRLSSYEAEKRFGIPRRTLLDKLHGKHHMKIGCPTRLSETEEDTIVNVLIAAGDYGSPLTLCDLKFVVQRNLENTGRDSIFNGKPPGDKWIRLFVNRHKNRLTKRSAQNIKRARASKTSDEMKDYFTNLKESLRGVPKENILNYDETNLADNPGSKKCLFRRGVKYPEKVINSTKGCISIMFAITAGEERLPPYVVYRSKNLYEEWRVNGPNGTMYNRSESGWFDATIFEDWFDTIVLPWARGKDGSKLLIGDNLASHVNVKIVQQCQENNIKFVFLPPNSSHLTQPLDVSYFAPMKKKWREILLDYKHKNPSQTSLNKCHFPELLKLLIDGIDKKRCNIVSAFKATGICPFNPENVLKRLPDYKPDQTYKVENALLDYLKENRSPNITLKKRNKKIDVAPGKSVSESDFKYKVNLNLCIGNAKKSIEIETGSSSGEHNVIITSNKLISAPKLSAEEMTQPLVNLNIGQGDDTEGGVMITPVRNVLNRNNNHSESSSSCSDVDVDRYSLLDPSDESTFMPSESESDLEQLEIENKPSETNTLQINVTKPLVNSYILVKFATEKNTRYYIGKVLKIIADNYFEVNFMRHKGKGRFIWPTVTDISNIFATDIEKNLPEPKEERRGALKFDLYSLKTYSLF